MVGNVVAPALMTTLNVVLPLAKSTLGSVTPEAIPDFAVKVKVATRSTGYGGIVKFKEGWAPGRALGGPVKVPLIAGANTVNGREVLIEPVTESLRVIWKVAGWAKLAEGMTAVSVVELTSVVTRFAPLSCTTVEATKPDPATVMVWFGAPICAVLGVMEVSVKPVTCWVSVWDDAPKILSPL